MRVEVRVICTLTLVRSSIAPAKFYSAETILNGLMYRLTAGNNVPEGIILKQIIPTWCMIPTLSRISRMSSLEN